MSTITETEFARIVDGLIEDRDSIIKYNPIGSDEEILLWMLLACLNSFLSLSEQEMPCFTGKPDAETYRNAILFVLNGRCDPAFEPEPYLAKLK